MRIGFVSGDIIEMRDDRKAVCVPDFMYHGYLIKKLRQRGHEVVVLAEHVKYADAEDTEVMLKEEFHPHDDPNSARIDVLFGDRLGKHGSEWDSALTTLERYSGPVVFHQYIGYPGWAPPFREVPHLLSHNRDWTIVNRSDDPAAAYNAMTGLREHITHSHVFWEKWEPFFMAEHPWARTVSEPTGRRDFKQGYYGRLPQRERRGRLVERYMSGTEWSKVIYGPTQSTRWMSAATGATDGGRVQYAGLPDAIETFDFTVQIPHDRFAGQGHLNIWPNRIGECALGGCLQLFDRGFGLAELSDWTVQNPTHLRDMAEIVCDPDLLVTEVARQREAILPHLDPVKNLDRLEAILRKAANDG